jgi:FKBP-type peptidyl-prolyl cis-trans isomerase
MKKYLASAALGILVALPVFSLAAEPKTFEEKLSYSMGFEVGNYFKGAGGDIQKEMLISGIEDAYNGTEPALTQDEMVAVQKEFAAKMQALQLEKMNEMKAANLAAGQAFLDKNKELEGVTVTESGLQYQVLQAGEGEKAKATDTVKVEYVGTLIDGTEFDSTAKHGQPAEFQVDKVIPGWSEALQLMSVGSKLKLAIPSELAYGEQGAAPAIQPNSVLVFEVELLSIEGKQ